MIDHYTEAHLNDWLWTEFIYEDERKAAKDSILATVAENPEWINPPMGQEWQAKSWREILDASDCR